MIDIKSIIDTLKNHFSQRTYILPLQVTVLFIFETNKPKTTRFSILSIPGASAIYITKKEKIEPFTIKEKNGTLLFKDLFYSLKRGTRDTKNRIPVSYKDCNI